MRVLITGGAGFIGSRTALALRARGHEVRIVDNLHPQVHTANPDGSPTRRLLGQDFDLIVADVTDRAAMERALDGCDAVLHLAAETGTAQSMYEIDRYTRTNVGGTAVLLELMAAWREQIRRVVVASSRSVYGEGSYRCAQHAMVTPNSRLAQRMRQGDFETRCPVCDGPVSLVATDETAPARPGSIYAVTKLAQEQLISTACAASNTPYLVLRYQNVYGPGQSLNNPYTGVLSVFSRLMIAGKPIEIFEDGLESRDFVFIDDVVGANVAALEAPESTVGVLNVGTGIATTIRAVVDQLADNYGYAGEIRTSGRFRAGDIRHNLADVARLSQQLAIECSTSFEDGIAQFCRWARNELASSPSQGAAEGYQRSLAELEARALIS